MSPTEIASRIVERAKEKSKHPTLFQDELTREISQAISEERELIAKYLQFLNEAIALKPELVRHQLLVGSTRITTGRFLEEMHPDEHRRYSLRLNPVRRTYYR